MCDIYLNTNSDGTLNIFCPLIHKILLQSSWI